MFVKVKCVLCYNNDHYLSVYLSDCCIYCTYCFLFWFSVCGVNLWNLHSAHFSYLMSLTVLSLSLSILSLYLLQLNLYITLTLYIAFIRRCCWSWAWWRRGIRQNFHHSIRSPFYEFFMGFWFLRTLHWNFIGIKLLQVDFFLDHKISSLSSFSCYRMF